MDFSHVKFTAKSCNRQESNIIGTQDVQDAARQYVARGFAVLPIPAGTKAPTIRGWPNLRLQVADIPRFFHNGANIGLILGEASGSLVDADLDAMEALALTGWLPDTDMIHGRPSKPRSHWWFIADPLPRTERFEDVDGATLVELRSTGGQTVVPPSIHPSGERLAWESFGDPGHVHGAELRRAVAVVAAGALLARHWPAPGARQEAALALAGGLLRGEWDVETVEAFIADVARAAGDEEAAKRTTAGEYTRRRMDDRRDATGWPTLARLMGDEVVRRVRAWLGLAERREEAPTREEERKRRPSQATLLVRLAIENAAEFWHTPDGRAFATVRAGDGVDHLPLRFKAFRSWLARLAMQAWGEDGGVPHASAVEDAITALEGIALYSGQEYPLKVRVGGDLRAVYLDLCDSGRRVVEITADGWRVVTKASVRFWRPPSMLPLPIPERGGSLQDLGRFLNVEPEDLPLVMGFLIGCLHPDAPYPVLALYGEQGTAKSTASRVLKMLIDPAKAPLRKRIKEERDLAIAATNGWLLAFDNLSGLPDWLSDALCGLATGLGFGTRRLFTDDEEALFEARRPIILNGIDELAVRGDLRDRMIALTLPPIPDDKRRPEADFWQEFERERPRLLGALLDAVAMAIRNLPTTQLDRLPRMADFALWVHAAEPALGQSPGTFLERYAGNRAEAHVTILNADPVGRVLLAWLEEQPGGFEWSGTATDMLELLNSLVPEDERPRRGWPKDATRMGGKLRRIAPHLRGVGVEVNYGRIGTARTWSLRKVGKNSVTSVKPGILASQEVFLASQNDAVASLCDAKNGGRDADDASCPNFSVREDFEVIEL